MNDLPLPCIMGLSLAIFAVFCVGYLVGLSTAYERINKGNADDEWS